MKMLVRFGLVGVLATLTHAFVFWALKGFLGDPALASGVGFLVALNATYWGQRLWVFETKPQSITAFVFLAVVCFALHYFGMMFLLSQGVNPWIGWFVMTILVPAFSFCLSKYWVFSKKVSQ